MYLDKGFYLVFAILIIEASAGYNGTTQGNMTDCGPVETNLTKGVIELSEPNMTTVGSIATVRCNNGFEAVPFIITCTTSGEWTEASCEPIDCGDPPNVEYGSVTLQDTLDTSYGAEAYIVCAQGYNASLATFICDETGYWENVTCVPLDCGLVPNNLTNGEVVLMDPYANTSVGAIATVYCDYGYEPVPLTINCTISGEWEEASCDPIDCGNPPSIQYGSVTLTDTSNTSFGAEAELTCDKGYNASLTVLRCGDNGNWTNATCVSIDCGPVPNNLTNGEVILMNSNDSTSFGAIANVYCDDGYDPFPLTINCTISGEWEEASCDPIDCGPVPNNLTNGEVILMNSNASTSFGAIANVYCDDGYDPFPLTINCTISGEWEEASCDPIDCGDPPGIEYGSVNLTDTSNTSLGAEAVLTCDSRYHPSLTILRCGEDGNWDNATCTLTGCGEVPEIEDGSIVPIDNSTFGSQANVTCNPGFTANQSIITCLSSGNWDDNVTCIRTECGNLPSIQNGAVTLTDTSNKSFRAEAELTCHNGFNASLTVLRCGEDGNWTNATCDSIDCGPVPNNLTNGEVTLMNSNASTSFGAIANVYCDDGYDPLSLTINCTISGEWEEASCDPIDCGDPPGIEYGSVALTDTSNTSFGAEAVLTCDSRYNASLTILQCGEDGNWDNATCTLMGCGEVPEIEDGSIVPIDNSTFGSQANVTCNPGFTANESIITCLSSGHWDDNVKCIQTDCGNPPSIQYGAVTLTDTSNTSFGAEAELTCDNVYNASLTVLRCGEDGNWTNATCDSIDCGDPPGIEYGSIALTDTSNTSFGAEAVLTCDSRYNASLTILQCGEDGNWDNATCTLTGCDEVPEIEDGRIVPINNSTFGSQANVTCNPGFTANESIITCLSSGHWEDNVTCIRTDCGNPPSIQYGSVTLTDTSNTSFGAEAELTCDNGYNESLTVLRCGEDGNWTNATCDSIDCGPVPNNLTNGEVTLMNSNASTSFGAIANVYCDDGYDPFPLTINCTISGEWEEASCDPIDCGDPPGIEYGSVALTDTSDTSFGAEAVLTCDSRYNASLTILQCGEDGNWDNATCTLTGCGEVPEIEDGSIVPIDNSTFGSQANVSCYPGFTANESIITCLSSGNWGDNVTCIRTDCGNPPSIQYGSVTLTDTSNTSFGAEAELTCDNGYNASLTVLRCGEDGNWTNATCDSIDCGPVPNNLTNGEVTLMNSNASTSFGAIANVYCDDGYDPFPLTINCTISGEWEEASCDPIDCGDPPGIEYGSVALTHTSNTSFGAEAVLTCDSRYNASLTILQCGEDGNWDNATCTLTGCGEVPEIEDGSIVPIDNSTFGSQANVTCNPGFTANESIITCLSSGNWDDNVTCIRTDCGNPPSIQYGSVTLTDTSNTSFGAEAELTCDNGYNASLTVLRCGDDGNWTNATCDSIDCGPVPNNLTNGEVTLMNSNASTSFGAIANVYCDDGYDPFPLTINCTISGEWEEASCDPNDCGDPPGIEYGSIALTDTSNTSFGAEAVLTCDSRYNASLTILQCGEDGNWDNATCTLTGCGEVPEIEDGSIVPIDNSTFGSQANVTCNPGFTANQSIITCLSSGNWDDNVTCIRMDCGNPPSIQYGSVTLTDTSNTSFGAEAELTCHNGYNASLTVLRCGEDGNWTNATCDSIDCGPVPNELANGEVVIMNKSTNTTYGATANVYCNNGYDPVSLTINCTISGDWEEASCEPKDCGYPPDIEYGSVNLTDTSNTSLGAEAVLTCDSRYNASLTILQCGEEGYWENATCTLSGCGDVPAIENGSIFIVGNSYFGSQANVTCNTGFIADISNITCLSTGNWDGNVTCLPLDCGSPPNIEYGSVTLADTSNTSFAAEAVLTCDLGYNASSSTSRCGENGNWTNATCSLIDCGPVQDNLANGEVVLISSNTNTTFGATATVYCNNGYDPVPLTMNCTLSGEWEEASCEPIDCGYPPGIEYGSVNLTDTSNTSLGAEAVLSCDSRYNASLTILRCGEVGYWDNATCILSGCGDVPEIEDGSIVIVDNSYFGSQANVTCIPGFTADRSNITCLTTGNWDGNVTCVPLDCGSPPNIEYGSVTLADTSNTSFAAEAVLTCDLGYNASSSSLRCGENGNWTNATCSLIDCGPVQDNLANGEVVLINPNTNTTFGATATVYCNNGYDPVPLTINCTLSGEWEEASCEPIDCGYPPDIDYGSVTLADTSNTSLGAEAVLTCDSRYNASLPILRCGEVGYWDNATCILSGCGDVPEIEDGRIVIVDNSYFGSQANVTCDLGFTADKSNITCLSSGNWDDNITCIRTGCGDVPEVGDGIIVLNDNSTFGSQANVSCNPGFTAGKSNITCLWSGNWSDNATCTPKDCGNPPNIEYGSVTLADTLNTSFAAEAEFTCDLGYNASLTVLRCNEDGNWTNGSCNLIDCGPVPGILPNGEIVSMNPSDNTTFGATATVYCNNGYDPVPLTINCTLSGEWEEASCEPIDCGNPPNIEHGSVSLTDNADTSFRATAVLTCDSSYYASLIVLQCAEDGNWDNATCILSGCGDVPEIADGSIVLIGNAAFGSQANVICDTGFMADKSSITCLTSGNWDDNVTCIRTECSVSNLPSIANGEVFIDTVGNLSTASVANVSCYYGYAPTSPVVGCLDQGQWQDDVLCIFYDLGGVSVGTGQDVRDGQYTAYFKCAFTIANGLKYRIKWFVNGAEFYDTGVMTSTQATGSVLTDDLFGEIVSTLMPSSAFFNLHVMCSAAVYDGAGETELESSTSTEITPLQVSTNSITMMRGKEATFTVFLNFPFGCSSDSQDCFLKFIVYDPNDSYRCYDSTIAAVHSDTCGGKIEGATPATIGQLSTTNTYTNITITTKNNRWYRLRSIFSLVLQLVPVGNSKTLWNSPTTSVSVSVTENYLTKYRGCYSFVDPYIYTFDRRWYSNQLLEEFVLFRHKTLPIEVQTVTAPCNGWATCSCAVTVRAGGDVFTMNHCSGHLSTFLSSNDGILKVYRLWSTYYQIILPTGMNVYVYVMSYFNYMMNVYVTPTPSDFEQMEGLCGNFNGQFSDDTYLRDTTESDPVESSYGNWSWWSKYFEPHTFAKSWGLDDTGRQDESLLNPDVYENVESWDSNKKLCVCPYANNADYNARCSADEEATCTGQVWHWGTRIEAQTRSKRDVDGSLRKSINIQKDNKRRLKRMRRSWQTLREKHTTLRKKRQVTNVNAITFEDAEQMCAEQLNNSCNTYSKKDDVSDVAESNDTLENCARDTAIDGTTEWVTTHCDALTQKVTVEIEKDVEFAENNTDLVDNIVENSCPSNCSGNGQCVNKTCICFQDFGTDLCLLNLTLGPLIEELADEGICDVSTGSECDYILIVGNGFVETAKCNLTVYVAGIDGNFNMTEEFEINCTYTTYNELYAQVPEITNSSEDTNVTLIARMYEISVSNDGTHFGSQEKVVVLDTTCQERQTNAENETIVALKSGYCYITGTCYQAGTYLNGSSCAKCDTSQNLFVWTDGCNNEDDANKNNLIIIGCCVGGAIVVVAIGLAVFCYKHMKAKRAMKLVPLVETSLGPSKMKFWYRKDSNVAVIEHHLSMNRSRKPSAANYFSDDDMFPSSTKSMTPNL